MKSVSLNPRLSRFGRLGGENTDRCIENTILNRVPFEVDCMLKFVYTRGVFREVERRGR